MLEIIQIITVIIGTLVGAGFASGKEIYIFFSQYGKAGLIGIVLTVIMIYFIIHNTIIISKKFDIHNNLEFIKVISKNKVIKSILKNMITSFLIVSFWIMCAGISTFFKQKLGFPIIISSIINSIIIYILLMKNIEGIKKFNFIAVPIMIVIIIMISMSRHPYINTTEIKIKPSNNLTGIIKSILYTSYNSITLFPIIISMSSKIKNKKSSKIITVFTCAVILVLLLAIYKVLIFSPINIKNKEFPILNIVEIFSKEQTILYSIVIVIAMLTSAISAIYGVIENIKNENQYKKIIIFLCVLSIPISYIGFGNLIKVLYPVFGVIGILQIISILKTARSIAKKIKN